MRATRHETYARDTAAPRPPRGTRFEALRLVARAALRLGGWRLEGDWPGHPRAVLLAVPHTSNWDGVWMVAAAFAWRIRLSYLGKASLTRGPFGGLVRWTGCVPVDRSRSNDLVRTIAARMREAPEMMLAVPPEGTRGTGGVWKTGFYQIALAAEVPILIVRMDYAGRFIRISGALWPSGDYPADLRLIASHYEGAGARYPDRYTPPA